MGVEFLEVGVEFFGTHHELGVVQVVRGGRTIFVFYFGSWEEAGAWNLSGEDQLWEDQALAGHDQAWDEQVWDELTGEDQPGEDQPGEESATGMGMGWQTDCPLP